MGKTAWRLREITNAGGTGTVIETRAESDLRPGTLYKWTAYVTQENDGRITTGDTTLTSVWEEKNQLERAIPLTERRPLSTRASVPPEKFEQRCEHLAKMCGDKTRRIEKEVIASQEQEQKKAIASWEQEEKNARRREKSGALVARLLAEGRDSSPGQDRGAAGGAADRREIER